MYELLKGLTIVEGASFIAAPSCSLYFRQMGSRVIRFDQIGGGPDKKRLPLSPDGESLYWEGLNKGKQSIALNLRTEEGRELAQRIATSGDGLFVTNFPTDGFLSYEKLAALRADLICLRVMGWSDGTSAVDYTINAAIGVPYMTGHHDDNRPVNHVLPAWDLLAGAYGAFSLLASERDRARGGKGREIRLALSDLAAATMGNLGNVAETLTYGDRARSGNDLFGAFGRDFMTADGFRLMIVALTAGQWKALMKSLDIAAEIARYESENGVTLTDEAERYRHREWLNQLVEDRIGQRTAADLEPEFESTGLCWSRYRTLSEAMGEEERFVASNPVFSNVMHPSGEYPTPGAAVRLADNRTDVAPAPSIGQHSDEILADMLGLSDQEIGDLHDRGIVA